MNRIFLVSLFFVVYSCKSQQEEKHIKEIDIEKLIEIRSKSDFFQLSSLVHSLGYMVLDSSLKENGKLFYYTKEPKQFGRTLASSADDSYKIEQLTFDTYSKEEYNSLKSRLKKLGFKSTGLDNNTVGNYLEAEDFEKPGIYIATSAKQEEDNTIQYEFTFIKW